MSDRIETGTVKFQDDWRGVFIRGDSAFGYALSLQNMLDGVSKNPFDKMILQELARLLFSADERIEDKTVQLLKRFDECKHDVTT